MIIVRLWHGTTAFRPLFVVDVELIMVVRSLLLSRYLGQISAPFIMLVVYGELGLSRKDYLRIRRQFNCKLSIDVSFVGSCPSSK
jgi:hypothetical protein